MFIDTPGPTKIGEPNYVTVIGAILQKKLHGYTGRWSDEYANRVLQILKRETHLYLDTFMPDGWTDVIDLIPVIHEDEMTGGVKLTNFSIVACHLPDDEIGKERFKACYDKLAVSFNCKFERPRRRSIRKRKEPAYV